MCNVHFIIFSHLFRKSRPYAPSVARNEEILALWSLKNCFSVAYYRYYLFLGTFLLQIANAHISFANCKRIFCNNICTCFSLTLSKDKERIALYSSPARPFPVGPSVEDLPGNTAPSVKLWQFYAPRFVWPEGVTPDSNQAFNQQWHIRSLLASLDTKLSLSAKTGNTYKVKASNTCNSKTHVVAPLSARLCDAARVTWSKPYMYTVDGWKTGKKSGSLPMNALELTDLPGPPLQQH